MQSTKKPPESQAPEVLAYRKAYLEAHGEEPRLTREGNMYKLGNLPRLYSIQDLINSTKRIKAAKALKEQKPKGNTEKRMIVTDRALFESQAWRSLHNESLAMSVYIELLLCRKGHYKDPRKRKGWVWDNDRDLAFSYLQAERLGWSRPRFSKAMKILVSRGLIDVVHQGFFKEQSTYGFSERWRRWK